MIRRGEYQYKRRGLGPTNKFGHFPGQSPASAGMPPVHNNVPPAHSSNLNSGALIKGSGYYAKGGQAKAEKPVAAPLKSVPPEPAMKEEIIVIHVCDEKHKVEKDFK